MRITGVGAYTQTPAIRPVRGAEQTTATRQAAVTSTRGTERRQQPTVQSVVSPAEKQFFAQLFPDYAQLRQDTLFNQQGRLQQVQSSYVGKIFDGRA